MGEAMYIARIYCEVKMYWYVIFVQTGRERKVLKLLEKHLDTSTFVPFIPFHERIFKNSGILKRELKPLFPGYVFVQSEVSGQRFIKDTKSLIHESRDIISILKYSDMEIEMRENERQNMLSLCNDDHCVESSRGIIEGDKIHIKSGPLKGRESIIKKVDRHKRQAWIQMEFMGDIRLVSVALEIVNKI